MITFFKREDFLLVCVPHTTTEEGEDDQCGFWWFLGTLGVTNRADSRVHWSLSAHASQTDGKFYKLMIRIKMFLFNIRHLKMLDRLGWGDRPSSA